MSQRTGDNTLIDGWFFDGFEGDTVQLQLARRPTVSPTATASLILGVLAVAATVTGLLAAVGVIVGFAAVITAVFGVIGASRHRRAGHGLAVLGAACGVFAVTLGVLAIGGHLPWLDGHTDQVPRIHGWLTAKLPWLRRWAQ